MVNLNIWSFEGESFGIRPKFSTTALKKRCYVCVLVASNGAHWISDRGSSALLQRRMRSRGAVAREILTARRDDSPLRRVLWRQPVMRVTTSSDALFTTVCARKCAAVCARLCAAVCAWKCACGLGVRLSGSACGSDVQLSGSAAVMSGKQCGSVRQCVRLCCAVVCDSARGSVRGRLKLSCSLPAARSVRRCGSVWQCGSSAAAVRQRCGSGQQCARQCARQCVAVCRSVWQCAWMCAAVWQCADVCGSARDSVQQ
jgi:hypothetical protein